MATAFASTTAADQQAAFTHARAIPLEDAIHDVLSHAIPVIACGNDEEFTGWIMNRVVDDEDCNGALASVAASGITIKASTGSGAGLSGHRLWRTFGGGRVCRSTARDLLLIKIGHD